jgi:NTE family protein
VLSGGWATDFAHVDVIKIVEANGIKPDLIVATIAGTIAGALHASSMSARTRDALGIIREIRDRAKRRTQPSTPR